MSVSRKKMLRKSSPTTCVEMEAQFQIVCILNSSSGLACALPLLTQEPRNQTEILRMLHLKSELHLLGSFHGPGVKSPINIRHNSNRESHPLLDKLLTTRPQSTKQQLLPSRCMVFLTDTHKTKISQNTFFTKAGSCVCCTLNKNPHKRRSFSC